MSMKIKEERELSTPEFIIPDRHEEFVKTEPVESVEVKEEMEEIADDVVIPDVLEELVDVKTEAVGSVEMKGKTDDAEETGITSDEQQLQMVTNFNFKSSMVSV